jgi:hypothetical protein
LKKITLLVYLVLLTMGCEKGDDIGTVAPNISGNWNLITVTGGVSGVNSEFLPELIIWNFQDGSLTIENNNTSGDTDLFASGTYTYSKQESQGDYFLFIDGADQGMIEADLILVAIDGRKHVAGMCNDCFNFTLRK